LVGLNERHFRSTSLRMIHTTLDRVCVRVYPRYIPVPGPVTSRKLTQPMQASLQFHPNNSFDSESVCSGTFTIDLNTLQNIQSRVQPPTRAPPPVNQPDHPRNNPRGRPRPHTSLSVNDPPEPGPYERGNRVAYSYPPSRQIVTERQPPSYFAVSAARQFNDRITTDEPRCAYPAAPPKTRYNFPAAAETAARYDYRDYNNEYDQNPHQYEPAAYNTPRDDGYRYQQHERNGDYSAADTDVMQHARADGYTRRLLRFSDNGFSNGGRADEHEQLLNDPSAVYLSQAPADHARYPAPTPHFNADGKSYEDYRRLPAQMKPDRYNHVPTRDANPAQMTGAFPVRTEYSETKQPQWQQSGRFPPSRSHATPTYHPAPSRTEHVQQITAGRCEPVPDSTARYPPSNAMNNVEPQAREARDRWKQTRFQDEQPSVRPARSSSVTRRESELQSQSSGIQSRPQYTARDSGSGVAVERPTAPSSLKPQRYRTATTDILRADTRVHADHSFSAPVAKDPEPASPSSVSGGRYIAAYPVQPGFPRNVPDERRGPDHQDERRSTARPTEKQYTPLQTSHNRGSSSVPGSKSGSPVSDVRREDPRGRRVKFQSDPDLSHKDDNATTSPQPVKDYRRSTDVKPTYTGGVANSGAGGRQSATDRRYQSAESLQSSSISASNSASRDQGDREYSTTSSGRLYSSQSSLLSQSRSGTGAGSSRQGVHRASSFDQVCHALSLHFCLTTLRADLIFTKTFVICTAKFICCSSTLIEYR